MKNINGNTKRPWRGRGGGRGNGRKSPGGRGHQGQRQDGSKKDNKIYQFLPFTSHNASTHHTYSDTKENFIHAASIKLGEYANDVRNALETEVPYVGTRPTRGQAVRMKRTMPGKISRREDEKDDAYEARQETIQDKMNAYLQEKAEHDFEQTTLDMEYKADMSEYQKRENAYQRNITRAFNLLMSQYCSNVINKRLEQESDYKTVVKDNPVEALKRIKVLAHNPARGRYHYACIYESIERFVNIQQQDKESTTAYLDCFEQNVDVMESYLPTLIIDSYVEGTAAYMAITNATDKLEHKKKERDAILAYVFVRRSNQKVVQTIFIQRIHSSNQKVMVSNRNSDHNGSSANARLTSRQDKSPLMYGNGFAWVLGKLQVSLEWMLCANGMWLHMICATGQQKSTIFLCSI